LSNLKILELIANSVEDVCPLKDLQNLQTLFLGQNQIQDVFNS
jgi:Leucine-rich repeat (LRR) protein